MNRRLLAAEKPSLDVTPRARIRPDWVITLKGGGAPALNQALAVALNQLVEWRVVAGESLAANGV